MGLINKLADKVIGYLVGKSGTWGKLWATAQEWKLFENTVTQPYVQVASVYKAVKAIADNVPQAELQFKDYENEKEVFPEDLVRLLDKPNPLMSGSDFLQAIVGFYALYGECFIIKQASIGQLTGASKLPAELWTFNPSKFTEIVENGELKGWCYERREFKREEVIHLKDFHPHKTWRGLAPTNPIAKQIDLDWASLIYNKAFFDNDATPGFMLATDKSLTDEQRKRLQEWWKKRHQGMSKAHTVAILEAGLKPQTTSLSHRDMDFIEQKRFMREEILGIWRAPKALFNITEDLNYATFMGQMKIFWLYTIAPILRKVEDSLNTFLVKPYDARIYCQFDYRNVPAFAEDFKDKVNMANTLFAMGFTGNELNEKLELGFDNKPWRDKWWVPFSMVPAGEALPQEQPTGEEAAKATNPNATGTAQKQLAPHKKDLQGALVWKQFVNHHTFIEGKFSSSLKRFFYEQRRRVLSDINKKDTAPIVLTISWSKEDEILVKRSTPYLLSGIKSGVNFGKEILQAEVDAQIIEQTSQAYLATRLTKMKSINATVRQQLKDEIEEGIRAGETISQISDRVRDVYNVASNRARTIARTETTGAVNGGSMMYYEEADVRKKQWVAAGDEATRDSHLAVNGEIRRMEEKFSNGLDYPGGDGPAEEVINCRCTIQPIIGKD